MDDILARIELPNIEEHVKTIIESSSSDGEMKIKFDHLAAIMNEAQEELHSEKKEGEEDHETA